MAIFNSDGTSNVEDAIVAVDYLDVELFNNDPDVAVDEYVLIFKRKP